MIPKIRHTMIVIVLLLFSGSFAQAETESTAAANVFTIEDFYIPQLDRFRRIWIYLPPDYEVSEKFYPVLYMHDGQRIFDDSTDRFSKEWQVDETLNELFAAGDSGIIVVGIDHGGTQRIDEYSPWVVTNFGGGEGSLYVDFIVNTLKPYIDSNYRTRPEREFTSIMGSSMGGLISMYAAIEHQNVFSKAGIFSPSFWFSDEAFTHVTSTRKQFDMRFYLIAGEPETTIVPGMTTMYNTLQEAGFSQSEMFFMIHPDGHHIAEYWGREFPNAYQWLFREDAILGDLNDDHDVDRDDMSILLVSRNTPASGPDDLKDLDGDGTITALDARKLRLLCTRPRCATE